MNLISKQSAGCRPLWAAVLCLPLIFFGAIPASGFTFPGSSSPFSSGIPGFSGPFTGMPGGMPGTSSLFPGFGSVPGMGNNWPDLSSKFPDFSRIFPNFSFNRNNYPSGPGAFAREREQSGPYPPLPPQLMRLVKPGAGAQVYDMAFIQDRTMRRARIIVLQTSGWKGVIVQRCTQYSMSPVMQCQAYVNNNVSRTYYQPPPSQGPLYEPHNSPRNGMMFSSKGRWKDMTVMGKFQYWPGRW